MNAGSVIIILYGSKSGNVFPMLAPSIEKAEAYMTKRGYKKNEYLSERCASIFECVQPSATEGLRDEASASLFFLFGGGEWISIDGQQLMDVVYCYLKCQINIWKMLERC